MQSQLFYDPAADRLLFALGLSERNVAFWLTRRLAGLLWKALWKRAGSAVDASASGLASSDWRLDLWRPRGPVAETDGVAQAVH